ncbi:MAG: hypothetical protein NZ481_09570, partial [Candidatus Kapabacteria bacterium]|nr:hypothetical protein [Candidatus Kapabacteria bacterium]
MKRFDPFAAGAASVMRLIVICALFFIGTSPEVHAQLWNWARGAGGQSTSTDYYAYGYRVAVDNDGNVYVGGWFYYYITIGTTTYYAYGGGANYDVFVAKYSSSGTLLWVRTGGGTSTEYIWGIDVDNSGNVYISGWYYSNPCYFGSTTLATVSTPDVYIVKYDANGNLLWAARQAGSSIDYNFNLAVNRQTGDCYIVGVYSSSTTFFSAGATSGTSLSSFGGYDGYIAKYNTNGVFQWARTIGGSGSDVYSTSVGFQGHGVGVDGSGNVYMCGVTYSSPTYIGSTSYSIGNIPYSSPETYLCKFDANGNVLWGTWGITGSNLEIATGLAVNSSGDIAIAGHFSTGPNYGGNNTSSNTTVTSAGGYDAFVVKFNTNGVVQWARRAGGTSTEYAYGVGIDNGGAVYTGGEYYSTASWSHGSTTFSITSGSTPKCYMVMWNTNGTATSGLFTQGSLYDYCYHFYFNPTRKEGALTGYYYSNPMIFGSGSGAPQLYNYIGYPAMFVGKFSVPPDFDLGLTAVASPIAPFSAGSQGVSVTMRNFGQQTITSAQITWSVNGVPQGTVNWTGSLPPNQNTTVTLGNVNFTVGTITTISATVCCPNNQADENAANNTITVQLTPGLSGTYTIGGSSPNFPDVVSAANALRIGGTLGAVTFNIRPGTYTGHVYI